MKCSLFFGAQHSNEVFVSFMLSIKFLRKLLLNENWFFFLLYYTVNRNRCAQSSDWIDSENRRSFHCAAYTRLLVQIKNKRLIREFVYFFGFLLFWSIVVSVVVNAIEATMFFFPRLRFRLWLHSQQRIH